MYYSDAGELVQGEIDVLIREEDGWVLADYKILFLESAEAIDKVKDKYKAQLQLYTAGLEKVGITLKESPILVLP